MKQNLILGLFWILPILSFTQDYAANLIPKELKSRASAVVRHEETIIDMKNDANISEQVSRAITILNKSGEDHAELTLHYNKSRSIKNIQGQIFDEFGKLIQKFNTKDFSDYSAGSQVSMFDDVRVKHYNPNVHSYPYTIVYTYEIKHNQNLHVTYWHPNSVSDIAVENSSYQFSCKPEQTLRIKEDNIPSPAVLENNTKYKTYTWKASNLNARKIEPFSPTQLPNAISVKIVPTDFQFFKKTGRVENWNDLGKWVYDELLKDKRDLSNTSKLQVRDLLAKYDNDKDKAKALYAYMQSKTRYISIQVGIGGIEPFPASYVDRLGYGDCKALVNYMQALLAEANIDSHYCIVEAGNTKIDLDKDFANIVDGNHIILCIPFADKDTTWLECTSNKYPFGLLGDFTDDRLVLACTPEGGKILRTPQYRSEDNLQARQGKLQVDLDGTIKGNIQTTFSGVQFDNHFQYASLSSTELNKELKEAYDINNIMFENIKYTTDNSDQHAKLIETIDLNIRNYIIKNGDNIIFQPNVFNLMRSIPDSKNRVNKLYINRGYTDIDEIEFELSHTLREDMSVINKKIECPMGKYELKIQPDKNKIHYYRKIELYDGTYDPEDYQKYYEFMKEVSVSDRGKFTLPIIKEM